MVGPREPAVGDRERDCHQPWNHRPFASSGWPAALLDLLPPDAPRNNWRRTLLRVPARMLYPSTLDLHGFRVLLMAATGHTSEEVLRGDPRKHRRRAP